MFIRRVLVIGACIGLPLVAACGSSSKEAAPTACSLLTPQTLSSLTDLSFSEGESVDSDVNQGCLWKADGRQGEVSVFVNGANSEGEFASRVEDASKTFGSAIPIDISGAKKSVEFGDFGLVIMTVNGRLIQVQQSLPTTVSPTVHRDFATTVARNLS